MKKYKIGIIGCGAILPRHIESIESNNNFILSSLCDIQEDLVKEISKKYNTNHFTDYKEMIKKSDINLVVTIVPQAKTSFFVINSILIFLFTHITFILFLCFNIFSTT